MNDTTTTAGERRRFEPHPPAGTAAFEALQRSSLLTGLDDDAIQRLVSHATPFHLAPGEVLVRQGEPADALYVVVEGTLDVAVEVDGGVVPVSVCGPGDTLGELALVADSVRSATVEARERSHLLRIDRAALHELLDSPAVARQLLAVASARLEERQLLTLQHTKMAALGQLTAGLLHELNNPTAALRRYAQTLRQRLDEARTLHAELTPAAAAVSGQITASARPENATADPLDRSDAEQRLQRWLTDRAVDEAWSVAPVFAAHGLTPDTLDAATATLGDTAALEAIVKAAAAALEQDALLAGLLTAAQRINETVAAVRTYTHHGEAPVQRVTLHDGIEQALTLLVHKIGERVLVERDYDDDLPEIEGYPGDLNTVWTNLIANALDAVGDEGAVTLRTRRAGSDAVVEVIDDGPGIPPDIQTRIFDPFFTTKPVGRGTGIGLGLVRTVVVQRHGGDISVSSEPGRTVFRVVLPLVQPSAS